MARTRKTTILIKGGTRRVFDSEYAAAKALGVGVTSVQQAKRWSNEIRGWQVYDSPEVILDRIAELEAQIKFLEG